MSLTERPVGAVEVEEKVTLDTICGGVAHDLFERELKRALDNIQDVNTDAEVKRTITLTFTLEPREERNSIVTKVDSNAKLAPSKGGSGVVWAGIDRRTGECVASVINLKQRQLDFDASQPKGPAGVVPGVATKPPESSAAATASG
jgi:hypothetical protein